MNKCDLEETKKLIELRIDEAIADEDNWKRVKPESHTLYYYASLMDLSPRMTHPSGVRAVKCGRDVVNYQEIYDWDQQYAPPKAKSSSRHNYSGGYSYFSLMEEITTVNVNVNDNTKKEKKIPPRPKAKHTPPTYAIFLNNERMGDAVEGSDRYAFFKKLEEKFDNEEECQRLLAALNPKKKEEKPLEAPKEPEADTSGLLGVVGAVVILMLFGLALVMGAVVSNSPSKNTTSSAVEQSK